MSSPSSKLLLGGLLGLNDSWFRNRGERADDMNKWIQNGVYYANKGRWPDIANFPNQELYGNVLVFGNNIWITQLFVNLSGETYIRSRNEYEFWSSWNHL